MKRKIEILSLVFGILAYVYIVGTTAVGTGEGLSLSTFGLWAAIAWITAIAMLHQKANPAIVMIYGTGSSLTTLILLLKGRFYWSSFDTLIAVLVGICIAIYLTKGAFPALLASIAAMTIATIPFLVLTWKHPDKSPVVPNFLFVAANVLNFVAAERWTIKDRLYSGVCSLLCFLLVLPWLLAKFQISYILFVISGAVFLIAFYPYLKAIVRRETSPRKVTWLVWLLGDVIVLTGMLAKHTMNGVILVSVLGAGSVFVLSLKYGESGWTKRDKTCLALSALAIMLWLYLGESNWGIAFSLLSLGIAAWPTYVSAYQKPENEDKQGWILFNLSSFIAVLGIPHLTFQDMAPAIAFMAIDAPMLYLLVFRKRKVQKVEVQELVY